MVILAGKLVISWPLLNEEQTWGVFHLLWKDEGEKEKKKVSGRTVESPPMVSKEGREIFCVRHH